MALGRQHENALSVSAYEVMPAEFVDKIIAAHGGAFRVTFSGPGKPPNRSEAAIPKKYRVEARSYVDKASISTRSIYFGGHKKRKHNGGEADAKRLIEEGLSRQATLIALGVTAPTLQKWVGKGVGRTCQVDFSALTEKQRAKYLKRGEARCEELGISKSEWKRDATHLEVGYAITLMRKWAKDETVQG